MIDDATLVLSVADAILSVVDPATDPKVILGLLSANRILGNELSIQVPTPPSLPGWQVVLGFKAALLDRLSAISIVCSEGASKGEILPSDPNPGLKALNSGRLLFQNPPNEIPGWIAPALRSLNPIAIAFKNGTLAFPSNPSAQVASYDVSLDGIVRQSGDALTDVLAFQPSSDAVKAKQALDAQATLDFTQRKPYLLFTADLIANGRRTGDTVICWQRMWDASGYQISKRDVFAMQDYPPATFTNEMLFQTTTALQGNDSFNQLISFYDWISPGDYFAYIDRSTGPDTVFSYAVTGGQIRAPSLEMFNVPTSTVRISSTQLQAIQADLSTEAERFGLDSGSLNPYPAIASVLYGDPGLGWVLAGCNVQKLSGTPSVSAFGFIGANPPAIIVALDEGNLVQPMDLSTVQASVETAITSYGVSQAMLAIFDGIGFTEVLVGKQGSIPSSPDQATGGLAKILSAIDPQTALVDPSALLASLTVSPSSTGFNSYVAQPVDATQSKGPSGPSPIDVIGSAPIDLTTFAGIEQFLTAIRDIYDFFPGLVATTSPSQSGKKPPPPPPPPPPPTGNGSGGTGSGGSSNPIRTR